MRCFCKTKIYNEKPFQKKDGSRLSVFEAEEKEMLLPLPTTEYELAIWKTATVQFNYHITIDKMWYSVPYEYIKLVVDIRATKCVVEVYYNNLRICSHPRLRGKEGQYNTIPEHMPEKHKSYADWNAERCLKLLKQDIKQRQLFSSHNLHLRASIRKLEKALLQMLLWIE